MTSIQIVEVGPRDGLQNEDVVLATGDKVELIHRLVEAGVRRIEVASFVHPERVPQMADAEAVVDGLGRPAGVSRIGLVLNRRGYDRAVTAGVDEVNVNVMATDTFNRRNQGTSTAETLAMFDEVVADAQGRELPVTLTIGASFGCPYEGEVALERVMGIVERGVASGASEIALADTIGVAVPTDVSSRLNAAESIVGGVPIRCHFHDTRNTGLANAYAAVEAGAAALDASIGGIGGCPFAPRATGNIATEDLVYLLDRMGVQTGLSLERLIEVVPWIGERLGRQTPGMLAKAGPFPA